MVAWYPSDGNANDIRGGNHGALQGNTTFAPGMVSQTFRLDGNGDRVVVGNSTALRLQDFTIDAWIGRASSTVVTNDGRPGAVAGTFFAYGNGGYGFGIDQTTNRLFLTHVENSAVFSTGTITDTNFHHVAVTRSGGTVTFYIDGVASGTVSYNPTFTFTTAAAIGARGDTDLQNAFFGDIDELEIFNRALSQSEVQAIVNAGSAGKCKSTAAATFTVNTTTDTNDFTCDTTHCSLREAIIAANANAGFKDTIAFNIPGAGVQTINIGSTGLGSLPFISDPVDINGYTQPGSAVNTATDGSTNAVLLIELNGQAVTGSPRFGLSFNLGSENSSVRGLVINRFTSLGSADGIIVRANNIFVAGSFIGTNPAGTAALSNDDGISIFPSNSQTINGTRIGSSAPEDRNLISGNTRTGIEMRSPNGGGIVNETEITGNLIGTNAQGTAAVGNDYGVLLFNVTINNARIGVPGSGGGNIISGNNSDGLIMLRQGGQANGVTVRNNRIGTNAAGTQAVPNGSNPRDPNSLSRAGIFIGLHQNIQIGGLNSGEGNLISGNFNYGIYLNGSSNNIIQGNLIGTDMSGTAALGNFDGVFLGASNFNIIGGTTAGARNVISGNRDDGIEIYRSIGNIVQGNFIGTDITGMADLGNNVGVRILPDEQAIGARDNTIGGTATGAGNRIAFNRAGGVSVSGDDSTGNSILANSIFSNTGLGIDLFPNGVTPNDAGDADTGANNLQNYTVLSSAGTSGNVTNVSGTFNSTPNTQFRIEFFSNTVCDPSGFGEGQTFIGSQSVTTDASGNATVNFTSSAAVPAGQFITSTATDPTGNTSEFSSCRQVTVTTAASVSIGGRVMTVNKRGISNVRLTLTQAGGTTRIVYSNAFGYYRFADVQAGETYIITASGKRFLFDNPVQALFVTEETDGINFTALP
jgi:CSLREA domain-containing protein